MTAPLTKLYHAKRSVRLRGVKLDGWSPADINRMLKRQPGGTERPSTTALDYGVAVLQQRLQRVVIGRGDVLAVWLAIREASDRERGAASRETPTPG